MKRVFLYLVAFILAAPLLATTVLYVPVAESVRLSGLIVKGEVVGIYPGFDAQEQIVTTVVLAVDETLKGNVVPGDTVSFQAWGGSFAGWNVETEGEASYELGEKILVQLEDIDGVWHTLGLSFGKWLVVKDADGGEILKRDMTDLYLLNADSAPVTEISLHEMKRVSKAVELGR
jgi:hypothetical protein